jgi:hypothetical protein
MTIGRNRDQRKTIGSREERAHEQERENPTKFLLYNYHLSKYTLQHNFPQKIQTHTKSTSQFLRAHRHTLR